MLTLYTRLLRCGVNEVMWDSTSSKVMKYTADLTSVPMSQEAAYYPLVFREEGSSTVEGAPPSPD